MAGEIPVEIDLPEIFNSNDLIAEITRSLETQAVDAEYKAGISRAVPGAQRTYGVRVPGLRGIAKAILKQYKPHSEELITLSIRLWDQQSREHRLIALFLLAGLRELTPAQRWELGIRFLPGISDWETCDQMCHALLGQALSEDPAFMDELESWLEDENFWVRRAGIVSTTLLRRAKYDEALASELDTRTLVMCAELLDDKEHYIRKAVDWAIRELIKRNEHLAYEWMLEQAQRGLSSVASSTLRLAARKLPPAKQKEFLDTLAG